MVSALKRAIDARASGADVLPSPAVRDDFYPIGTISEAGALRIDPLLANTEAARQVIVHLQRIRDDEYTDSSVVARCVEHHKAQESLRIASMPKSKNKAKKQAPGLLKEEYGRYT